MIQPPKSAPGRSPGAEAGTAKSLAEFAARRRQRDPNYFLSGRVPEIYQGYFLRQHRTIASASLRRLFAPLLQFEKQEIHTGFLRFPNFELGQKSCLRLLAELRGAALKQKKLRPESRTVKENKTDKLEFI